MIRIAGNHFVDGHGEEIRLLGVNFAGVEGACVDTGFQQGATDQHPGAVFDYQGPSPVVVPGQPGQPAEAFFATLAAWHVNAVRFMVNEMCWLGRPPNPRNNPAVAPIPQAHYSAGQYRQAIETFIASLHRYGMIAVPVLGDNPCPRNGLSPPGSQYSPCSDNQQVMPDAANAPDFWRSFASTFKNDHSMAFELFNEPHPEAVRPDINVLGCWRNGCEIQRHVHQQLHELGRHQTGLGAGPGLLPRLDLQRRLQLQRRQHHPHHRLVRHHQRGWTGTARPPDQEQRPIAKWD